MGSAIDDSFDTDQQHQIDLLDNQWQDLVDKYVKEPEILNFPPNDDKRFVLQNYKTGSPDRKTGNNFLYYNKDADEPKRIISMNSDNRTL